MASARTVGPWSAPELIVGQIILVLILGMAVIAVAWGYWLLVDEEVAAVRRWSGPFALPAHRSAGRSLDSSVRLIRPPSTRARNPRRRRTGQRNGCAGSSRTPATSCVPR